MGTGKFTRECGWEWGIFCGDGENFMGTGWGKFYGDGAGMGTILFTVSLSSAETVVTWTVLRINTASTALTTSRPYTATMSMPDDRRDCVYTRRRVRRTDEVPAVSLPNLSPSTSN